MKDDSALPAASQPSVPGCDVATGADDLWAIGSWLSAALDDPNVCEEMKRDIREWFDGGGYVRQAATGGDDD